MRDIDPGTLKLHTDKAVVRIVPADRIRKQKTDSKHNQPPEPSLAPRADAVSIFKNSTASAISIPDYILKQSNSVSYAIVTFAYDNPGIPPLQILADGCSAFLDKHLMKQFCRRQNRFA